MTDDTFENIIEKPLVNEQKKVEKKYKTKDYVRRAQGKYIKNRLINDHEFKEKVLENSRRHRENHKEELNEKAKLRMREYRKNKKEKELLEKNNTIENITDNLTNITVS